METPTTHPSTGHAPSSTTQASSAAHVPSTTAQAPSTGHVPSTGHAPSTTAQAPSTGHVPSTGRPPSTGHPPSTTRPPSTGHTAGHPQGVALLYTTSGSQMSHMGNMTSLVGPPLAGGLWAGAGGLLAALACDAAAALACDAGAALPGGAGACGGDVASDPAVLEPRRLYPAEDEVARRWWAMSNFTCAPATGSLTGTTRMLATITSCCTSSCSVTTTGPPAARTGPLSPPAPSTTGLCFPARLLNQPCLLCRQQKRRRTGRVMT